MAGKGKVVGYAVKYGVKYGPHLLVAAKALKEPATAYAQKRIAAAQARKAALAEAATLAAGTVLKVFHNGQEVWVVYSGEEPVSAHPAPSVPLATLVDRADLSLRVAPAAVPSPKDRIAGAGAEVADRARSVVRRRR